MSCATDTLLRWLWCTLYKCAFGIPLNSVQFLFNCNRNKEIKWALFRAAWCIYVFALFAYFCSLCLLLFSCFHHYFRTFFYFFFIPLKFDVSYRIPFFIFTYVKLAKHTCNFNCTLQAIWCCGKFLDLYSIWRLVQFYCFALVLY